MKWNRVFTGDCLDLFPRIPTASVDLVFADPPFNIGYNYDQYDDHRSRSDYLAWADRWLAEVQRVLKPTGTFWLAIGDEYVAEYKVRLDALGLTMRNWVVWHYTFGVHCERKFTRSHAHLLYYVTDPKRYTFHADAIRVPSARQLVYADKRANPKGRVPDDTWVLRPQEDDRFFRPDGDTWYVPRVCGTFKERVEHPCQMPEAVLDRIIRVSSNAGDVVLDPFAGSGTTLVVAKRLGRAYLGMELSARYATQIRQRLGGEDIVPRTTRNRRGNKVTETERTSSSG
jgi:site-specific DNA-methyltransferase (adenine-specific)